MQNTVVFLWYGHALYLGAGRDSDMHKHHLIQIGVSFAQPFAISTPDTPLTAYQSFIVAPNTQHQILSAHRDALFAWTEPDSFSGVRLQEYLVSQNRTLALLPEYVPAKLSWPLSDKITNCREAKAMFYDLMQEIKPGPRATAVYDKRIQHITSLLKRRHFVRDLTAVTELAKEVHLSPSRLRHLFKQQIGLSLQHYLRWQRLLHAVQSTAEGNSLTQAAHDAGFADAAHLSRTFRRGFGLTPSEIFNDSHSVQVYACQE